MRITIGRSPYLFYHADDLARIIDSHSTVIKASNSRVVYRFFNKKLNRHVWVQTFSNIVMDDATGKPVGIICRTSFCDALSVSVLAPAQHAAIQYPQVRVGVLWWLLTSVCPLLLTGCESSAGRPCACKCTLRVCARPRATCGDPVPTGPFASVPTVRRPTTESAMARY